MCWKSFGNAQIKMAFARAPDKLERHPRFFFSFPIFIERNDAVGIRRVRGGKNLLHRLGSFQNVLRNLDLKQFPRDRLHEPHMEIEQPKIPENKKRDERQNDPPHLAPRDENAVQNAIDRCFVASRSYDYCNTKTELVQGHNNIASSRGPAMLRLRFPHAIPAVRQMFEKCLVLQIDDHRVRFEETLFRHVAHDIFRVSGPFSLSTFAMTSRAMPGS